MNLTFYSDPVEQAVVKEIMQWSKEVLEKPNAFFNNLPPCPYARSAWLEDKVSILFKHEDSYQVLYSCVSQFDDRYDLVIIVDLLNKTASDEFHEYFDSLNEAISSGMFIDKDMWVMGFHPDDDPSDFVKDIPFEPETDTVYSLVFVQRLSTLHRAADKLDKKGYYESYAKEYDAEDIFRRRKELYGRLSNGHET